MSDPIHNRAAGLDTPSWNAVEVTPDDDADLSRAPCQALYIGTGGNLKVTRAGGGVVTYVGVLGGTILPFRVDRVWETGTTASDIVAEYQA
jgi:hypothetical protein